MKVKTVLKFILFSFLLWSCSSREDNPKLEKGIAIISGKVSNCEKETKSIRFTAGSVVDNIEKTAIINSDGSFLVELELYYPQNIQGILGESVFNIFARPSDSIYISIDEELFSQQNSKAIQFSGTSLDAQISTEIQQYFNFMGDYSFSPDPNGKTVQEYLDVLSKEIKKRDSLLLIFCNESNTSDEFKQWASNNLRYANANYLLNYKFANQGYKGKLFDELVFPVNNDGAIISDYYAYHLRHFALNLGIWQDTLTLRYLEEGKTADAYQHCLDVIVSSVTRGLSRDIMCYKILNGLINESFEDYNKLSINNGKYIDSEVLISVLHEKEEEFKKQSLFDIASFDSEIKKEKEITGDFWKEFKERYKGKVVYVDIWATWCVPCRNEIPYAAKLHHQFESKEVAFVNLCLESNKSEWKKTLESSKIKGDNFFFNKLQSQLLREELRFDGFPTYIIVDRQGNIVDMNAPRPSSGEKVKKVINKWIDKNSP